MNSRKINDQLDEQRSSPLGLGGYTSVQNEKVTTSRKIKRDYTSHIAGLIKNSPHAYCALNSANRQIAALEKRFGPLEIEYQQLEVILAQKKGYNSDDGFFARLHKEKSDYNQEKSDYSARQEKDQTPQLVSLIKKHKNIETAANAVVRHANALQRVYGKVNIDYAVIEDELDKISWFEPEMLEGLSGYADYLEKSSAKTAAETELDQIIWFGSERPEGLNGYADYLGKSSAITAEDAPPNLESSLKPVEKVSAPEISAKKMYTGESNAEETTVEAIYLPPALPAEALVTEITGITEIKKPTSKHLETLTTLENIIKPATPLVNPQHPSETSIETSSETEEKSRGIFARARDYFGKKITQGLKNAALYATVVGAIFVNPESTSHFAEANYLTSPSISISFPEEKTSYRPQVDLTKYSPKSNLELTLIGKDVKSTTSFINSYSGRKVPYQQYEFSAPEVVTVELPALVNKDKKISPRNNNRNKIETPSRSHTQHDPTKFAGTYLAKVDLTIPVNPEMENKLNEAFTGELYHPEINKARNEGLNLNVISGTIDNHLYHKMPKKELPPKEASSIIIEEPLVTNNLDPETDQKIQGNALNRGWRKVKNLFGRK